MYKNTISSVPRQLALLAALVLPATAGAQVPPPDHVVVVFEENHSYSEIIGNSAAPYINNLAANNALFTNSHGVEHPSQPNYLDFYSGSNQGVAGDNTSPVAPFTTANLGAGLFAHGRTFADFSEGLPYSVPGARTTAVAAGTPGATAYGFLGDSQATADGPYERKHNPASNWQNEVNPSANQLPATVNQPFSAFPVANFSSLPTVSFVIPNQQHDMHDGTIAQGDNFLGTNIEAYRQWAQTHNSLLIVTFDENDFENVTNPVDASMNQIVTIFSGQNVKPGQYGESINHFNVLHTIEDFYGVPASNALTDGAATPITDVFVVPEPGPLALALLGGVALGGVALARRRQRPTATIVGALAVCAILSLGVGAGTASATTVIAPNNLPDPNNATGDLPAAQTYGDTSNLFPLFPGAGTPLRYQQVYAGSEFSAFATGGEDITQIAFRVGIEAPDRTDRGAFAATILRLQITLSTTGHAPDALDGTFANNVGADAVTVFGVPGTGSPLAVSSTGAPLTGTAPAPFDIVINLTTPFHYDPSKGNLLLDVSNYQGAASPTGVQLDGTFIDGDAVSQISNFGDASATTATQTDTEGLVTQFSTGALGVPEPGTVALLAAALPLALFFIRRRLTA